MYHFCPFKEEMLKMDGDWRIICNPIRPDIKGLVPALNKELSPCSEHTRFSAEGRFPGPGSSLNAVLDVDILGLLFVNGPFKDPRWSAKLGYGMGVLGNDTRVHLYSNGKYVVRRALDREHADRCLSLLASICQPAAYSSRLKKFTWEIVRDLALGHIDPDPDVRNVFNWQIEDGSDIIEDSIGSFKKMDNIFGTGIGKIIGKGEPATLEDIDSVDGRLLDHLNEGYSNVLSEGGNDLRGAILGISSFTALAQTALWSFNPGP